MCFPCKPEEMILFDGSCKLCPDGSVPIANHKFCMSCPKSLIASGGVCTSCPDPEKELPNQKQTGCDACPNNLVANATIGECWCPRGDLVFNNKWDECVCPGDKVPSLLNELWCNCPLDSIEGADHKCIVCNQDGEVPNEEQSACVDCKEPSDCPIGGQNYNCTSNVCSCISGHVKDGEACVVPVRLGGIGSSDTEGYVEALDTANGQWGGVCNNSFNIFDAHVICKMLGHPTAIDVKANGAAADLYGTAPSGSNFTLNNLNCDGTESSIFDCQQTGESDENCEASEIAGVKCATTEVCNGIKDDVYKCCSSTNQCDSNQGDCDSDSECSGNLVCGTDNCHSPFPTDADCCTECTTSKDCPNGGTNYLCSANRCECPMVLDGDKCVECVKKKDCPNGGKNYKCRSNLCECPSPMFLDGDKCVECLTSNDCQNNYKCVANLCKCPNTMVLNGDICTVYSSPSGCNWSNENDQWECCVTSEPCGVYEGDCDVDEDCIGDLLCGTDNGFPPFEWNADLCYNPTARVRLGGIESSAKHGFVEGLGTNGIWGGICDHGFDIDDAHVICRMLGYPSAKLALSYNTIQSPTVPELYGTAPSGNNFVLDDLGCTGTEDSVFDCSHPGEWQENCVSSDIAGVHCATSCMKSSDCPNGGQNYVCVNNVCECEIGYRLLADGSCKVSLRLGGTGSTKKEGYVEALGLNGKWGGICDDLFDIKDANVICRMLGFPSATAALTSSTADDLYGTAPSGNKFVLDNLGCYGNETSVFDCIHPGEWNTNCTADEIAGVQCAAKCKQKSDCPYEGLNYKCNIDVCECEFGFTLNDDACVVQECKQKSDCPNEGLNYKCNNNVCECESGFTLNGETCEAEEMVTLLVTGYPVGGKGKIEIIKENFQTEVCNQMQEYPLEVFTAAGSTWKDGKLSICGGKDGSGNDDSRKSQCYTLDKGVWKLNIENLQRGRNNHGASNIGDAIWITGGFNIQRLASTEIIYSDGKITPGPDLPEVRSEHCQITYEQTTFIIGGWLQTDQIMKPTATVLRFNSSNFDDKPVEEEPMVYSRTAHACTSFRSALHDRRPVIIVVGSSMEEGGGTAEILDFTKEGTSWKKIDLPKNMLGTYGSGMTPTSKGDNVILTSGKSIYTLKVKKSKYEWIKLPQKLSIYRSDHVQALVPASTIQC